MSMLHIQLNTFRSLIHRERRARARERERESHRQICILLVFFRSLRRRDESKPLIFVECVLTQRAMFIMHCASLGCTLPCTHEPPKKISCAHNIAREVRW